MILNRHIFGIYHLLSQLHPIVQPVIAWPMISNLIRSEHVEEQLVVSSPAVEFYKEQQVFEDYWQSLQLLKKKALVLWDLDSGHIFR